MYQKVDTANILSDTYIPPSFHEKDPSNIVPCLFKYVQKHPDTKYTSVAAKQEKRSYGTPYALYHDLKVASAGAIKGKEVGSQAYREIDFFYKFATELLLRDVLALNLSVTQGKSEEDDSQLLEDFNKITHSYNATNGEVIVFINEIPDPNAPTPYSTLYQPRQLQQQAQPQQKMISQPLFSEIIERSDLDTRQTVVPDPYLLTRIVPQNKTITNNSATMRSLSLPSSRIPPPTSHPTQILDNFFHPNWYTIETPKWLIYKQKVVKPPLESKLLKNNKSSDLRTTVRVNETTKSFAPTIDLKKSVVSDDLPNTLWLHQIGFQEINKIKEAYFKSNNDNDAPSDSEEEIANEKEAALDLADEDAMETDEPASQEIVKNTKGFKEVNIANIASFEPEKFAAFTAVKSSQAKISKSPKELQRLVSVNLLKLNRLRQERYLNRDGNGSFDPSKEELSVYNKIVHFLSILLDLKNENTGRLSLEFSKNIPVLLNNYNGVLPGPLHSNVPMPTRRLPTVRAPIRGPYKKRNRLP